MKKSVTSSAPGKFHLIGEFSAVFGKPAILCAIDKRVCVKLTVAREDNFFLDDKKAQSAVEAIRDHILKTYKLKKVPVSIKITSDLPIGSGLGSSAALSAALAGALFQMYDLRFEKEKIFDAAYEGEKVFHGNPSGGDLAVCIYGGIVWFRKETEGLKLFKKIAISIKSPSSFIIIDSGKALESTKEMVVDVVGKKFKESPKAIGLIIDAQETVAKDLGNSIIVGDNKMLEFTIMVAEENLESLGVVGLKAKKIIKALEKAGIPAKISGSGGVKKGSGMLFCLPKNVSKIKSICKENNWEYFSVNIEKEGLRIEK